MKLGPSRSRWGAKFGKIQNRIWKAP